MTSFKRLLNVLICVTMLFSCIPVLGEQEVNTFLQEDFNTDNTGGMPVGSFKAQKAGGAELGVVEVPDAKNKSVYLRGASGGTASMTAPVVNPDALPITLSFRFMLPDDTNKFYVRINDSFGNSDIVISITDNILKCGEKAVFQLKKKVWYYASATFDFGQRNYRFSLDGETAIDRFEIESRAIDVLSLEVEGNNCAIYLDDIMASKASVGGPDREWWPSKMWLGDAQQLAVDDIALGSFTMFHGSKIAYKNGVRIEMPARVEEFDGVLYIPLRFSAEALGAEVVWNEVENAVYMMFLGKTVKLSTGDSKAYTDGVETILSNEIKNIGGITYISALDLGTLLEQKVNCGDNGYIMFGPDWEYYNESETAVQQELYRMVKYERPDGDTVYNALLENNPNKDHPRIMARAEDFVRVKTYYENQSDTFLNNAFAALKAKTDVFAEQNIIAYKQPGSGVRQHSTRNVHDFVYSLMMMYRLTGEQKYLDKAKEQIISIVTQWPELGEKATLDLGDNSELLGVAYDWLYDEFTENEKELIRTAFVEKLFPVFIACYRGDTSVYTETGRGWISNNGNFNSNLNRGIIMGILATADDFDEEILEKYCKPILKYAFRGIEDFLDEWYPDGAWFEGPGYGEAVIIQMTQLLDSISTACGNDFGLNSVPGLFESGLWSIYIQGAVAVFNYSDTWETDRVHQPFFWLSNVLDENIFTSKRVTELQEELYKDMWPIELIWYNPERVEQYNPPEALDKYFRKSETVVMRSGFDKNDWFAGLHAGQNGITHSHIDTGTLVLDWGGTRWIKETGVDSATYNAAAEDSGTFYRTRAEGHNTIVIDETPYKVWADGEWPIIFEDDFEGYEVNSDPSNWKINETNNDPNGLGELGIVNVEYMEKDGDKKNKAMHLEQKKDGDFYTGYYAQRLFGAIGRVYVTTAFELSFKYKLEKINQDGELGMNFVSLYSPAVNDYPEATNSVFTIRKKANSTQYKLYVKDGTTEIEALTVDPTKWYDIKIILDIPTQTMNVYIDGVPAGVNLNLAKHMEGVNYVRFTSSGQGNISHYLDDVVMRTHPVDSDLAKSSARVYDQTLKCNSPIVDYVSKPKGSYAVTDMTEAYRKWATSAKRGMMFTDNRNALVVRDEISLRQKSDVYWFAHSAKKHVAYEVSEDGKSVIMKALSGGVETGARMWAGIISDTPNAKFEIMEAEPLPGSPTPSNQANNSSFHKLAVKLEGVEGDVDLAIAFVPLEAGETTPESIPENKQLSQWSIPDGERPELDTLTLNGAQIENFVPNQTVYNVTIGDDAEIPVVSAIYQGQAVEVDQPDFLGDSATFSVLSGGEAVTYKVNFFVKKLVYAYIQGNPINDSKITASSLESEDNGPAQIIDKNMETSCTSFGDGEYVIFDFEKECDFSQIEIAWKWGDERNYKFDILYSNDGINWEHGFSGVSSGKSCDYELYDFGKTISGRYLKLVGHGSNANLYNNMLEIR